MRRVSPLLALALLLVAVPSAPAEPPAPRTAADYAALAARSQADRASDAGFGAAAEDSALPSGRIAYRRLTDYTTEMDALAAANPDLVKPITLAHKSVQGRAIQGLEITTDPNARDGKPAFLLMGLHHANEWPSGEHAMEWAYDLIGSYRAGDTRTRALVGSTRTIIVPVVNPDGFNFSREAQTGTSAEEHRKNCRGGTCVVNGGVDLNRNYSDLWGGPGATSDPNGNYRGPAPFSEPEARGVRDLIAGRQVTVMITNHTSGRLILRMPGMRSEPVTPDEPAYKALGASFAAENGYRNQFSWELYDHTGMADEWTYYSTGGLGYVFEVGQASHGPYSNIAAEYDGTGTPGGGNREAYYKALAATANPALHSVLTGNAPPGTILRLRKSINTRTWTSATVAEGLDTTTEVPASGRFEWHVNGSGRPRALSEAWTLTCESKEGEVLLSQSVQIARGQSREISACSAAAGAGGPGTSPGAASDSPQPPVQPADTRRQPLVHARLSASFDGRLYRIRVKGSLRDEDGRIGSGSTCAGDVALTVTARGKRIAAGRAPIDGACGYARGLNVRAGKLPRALRRSRLRSLRALATWKGNQALRAGQGAVGVRVKTRRR